MGEQLPRIPSLLLISHGQHSSRSRFCPTAFSILLTRTRLSGIGAISLLPLVMTTVDISSCIAYMDVTQAVESQKDESMSGSAHLWGCWRAEVVHQAFMVPQDAHLCHHVRADLRIHHPRCRVNNASSYILSRL